jgi:hypothetical protein
VNHFPLLSSGITQLAARRLTVKKVQQSIRVSSHFVNENKSILDSKIDLDGFVRDGYLTQEQADEKLRHRMSSVGVYVLEVRFIILKLSFGSLDAPCTPTGDAEHYGRRSLARIERAGYNIWDCMER